MSFAAPLALWLLGLGAAVLALYVLRVRRRRVTVLYLRLWDSLVAETRARSLFQRLRRLLSLLLQLLILIALVLAVARPSLDLGHLAREHVVLLLDVSASMQAIEPDGRRRFEHMLEAARGLVEDRSFEDAMMIAAVSDRVEVLTPFSRNTLMLREALERARPTSRSLDAKRAWSFAREVTAEREQPRIRFLSDGDAGRVRQALGNDERGVLDVVGAAAENVGIVRFSARKNRSVGTDYVLAVMRNFGERARAVRVELSIDGSTQKVLDLDLAAGATATERFQLGLPQGGTLRLALDHDDQDRDALALDDTAWAVVGPDILRRIVLVTPDRASAEPFRIAFESMRELVHESSMGVTAGEYAGLDDDERRADVTIVLNEAAGDLPAAGNLILINTPAPPFLPMTELGAEDAPEVWDWDREHLLNRYLNYRELPIPPARIVRLASGEALVRSYEGPLVSAFDLGDRRAIYVGFDMTSELFPFRLAFPILLRNAIGWFEAEEDQLLEDSYPPGAVITPLRRVAGDRALVAFRRDGVEHEVPVPIERGRFLFDDTDAPGPYRFTIGGRDWGTCVNLFDPAESSVAPDDRAGREVLEARPGPLARLLRREPWLYLAMLALVVWALEWGLYHRRVTE